MQHLTTLKLISDMSEVQNIPSAQMHTIGPYLQGVLMEHLDQTYVSYLHTQSFNPYSQYCYPARNSNELIWYIHALTNEATEHIIRPMQGVGSFYVKGIDMAFPVKRSIVETTELKYLTDLIRDDSTERSSVTFLTPTSFKSAGSYTFMPSVRLMHGSRDLKRGPYQRLCKALLLQVLEGLKRCVKPEFHCQGSGQQTSKLYHFLEF